MQVLKRGGKGLEIYVSKIVYSHEAELRIDSLLGSARVAAITMVFSDYLYKTEAELKRIPEEKPNSITDSIEQVTDSLKRLRRYLMHFQIKAKRYIYETGTSGFVIELKAELERKNWLRFASVSKDHKQRASNNEISRSAKRISLGSTSAARAPGHPNP